ncbi:TPA: hypothetical protein ACYQCT_001374 [Streptococcus pneumoniae]|nr:hypothetical protein [Streptococcus pneumoniae]MDS2500500.1 hypothetical protein [Streptococcus pneumoniae]MDS3595258.1 hypothetical protein [Streptococcus pneumoniae]QBX13094.1 hypothetical protein JavanS751_0017 [Streptococcus satellite phage Javan751]
MSQLTTVPVWTLEIKEKFMTENKDNKLLEMMEKGFVLYSKNGIIKYIEIPDHGSIKLKAQDGQLVYKEVTTGEQC